jgi:spore germination cell wall hydrolase CwlJ-like protein
MAARRSGRRLSRRRRAERQKSIAILLGAGLVIAAYVGSKLVFRRHAPRPSFTMEQARAANAAIPFVSGPLAPAPRFVFHGTPASRLQATECLATVAIYEAGDDPRAQKAVMQVVLNRVLMPGFPKTVCGVVYQGAGLRTGCQFSFACDGSVQRRPERAGWIAARRAAGRALAGSVDAEVGTATHYHTDWIVPYWIGSLDKIAKVDTHIFYRPHIASPAH